MIPAAHITEWRNNAPWRSNEQVEQDLIISRCLVELFSDPFCAGTLVFRGGTAIHKLFLPAPMRYSEDIDLVQTEPGPIGPVFDSVRKRLAFLGKPRIAQKERNNVLTFSTQSTIPPAVPIKLKIEINCREHIEVLGVERKDFSVASLWFKGRCVIPTYSIEVLLGSKMRALYQRRKGRDLFDIWYALSHLEISIPELLNAFRVFMDHCGSSVSSKEFLRNMEAKMADSEFRNDTAALLRPEAAFAIDAAWERVRNDCIARIDSVKKELKR